MWRNWVGNQSCEPARTAPPESGDEVCELVAAAARDGLRVRVAAAGHSFTPVVVTNCELMLASLPASVFPMEVRTVGAEEAWLSHRSVLERTSPAPVRAAIVGG